MASTTNVQKEIDLLTNEWKTLRLPHKLKQYRQYEKCLERLKLMASSSSSSAESKESLIEQINQLYIKLDKSVICGVDQCFICGNCNDGGNCSLTTTTTKSTIYQKVTMDKQHEKQLDHQINDHNNNSVIISDDHDVDQLNDSNRLLQTTRARLRSTSPPIMATNKINPNANVIESKKSTLINQIGISDCDRQNVDDVVDNKKCNGIDSKQNSNNSNGDQINDNESSIKILDEELPDDSSPSVGRDCQLSKNLNIESSSSSSTLSLMMPRPFQKLSPSSSSNDSYNGSSSGSTTTTIISGRSPPIISSYKAYKDFINNYTTTTTTTAK
ncbi:hypothetical protein DERF_001184 [Dermatophagoides farinae]|uniref:Uncharacterized protein n=1 Tax=Dermatophagoides farinae TaxID=6954 RepID=A0A922IAD0_DERFA|nr:hypothetical protein DERF_001184 [Dermatophagoides farinae]